jgi:nanoRNase/pAp phosphatase (c-di-AMP/oligoRNAs hydrolase)
VTRSTAVLLAPPRRPSPSAVVTKFGRVLGKRFARANLPLLEQAYSAQAGRRRWATTIRGRGANIFTQWTGDPDALGSAVLLEHILRHLGATEVRILTGSLGHPQNRALVEKCGIVLHHPNRDRLPRGLHCMVDTSPPLGMSNTAPVDAVREYFFVADHHADLEEVAANCRAQGVRDVKLPFVGLPVGSTSSFMAVVAAAFGLLGEIGPRGRAAAALGIYTDTSALLHAATPLDFRMFEELTRDPETEELLDDLRDYRVPPEWVDYRTAAFQHVLTKGGVRIAPVGYVRDDHRDVIAEIANELLRVEGTSIAIAVAVTERGTEFSVRGDSKLLGEDRERIVRIIDHLLEYAFPGASGFKHERRPPHRVEGGAFVPHAQSQQRLWGLGGRNPPDGDPILEHCRACARAIVAALEDIKFTRPEEIQGLL